MSASSREWVTPEQLSKMTGLGLSRLRNQRYERKIFPHYPIEGTRQVVYDKAEVDAVIAAGRIGTVDEEEMPGVAAPGKNTKALED